MTTIILTIIGILLAAAAALMVIFYGGDAFSDGATGAMANTIINNGTNVTAALQMHKAEKGSVPVLAGSSDQERFESFLPMEGVGGRYLKEAPSTPSGTVAGLTPNFRYVVMNVPTKVCNRINANLKLRNVTSDTPYWTHKVLCIPNSPPFENGSFYALY